jgi:hypothetical protein
MYLTFTFTIVTIVTLEQVISLTIIELLINSI